MPSVSHDQLVSLQHNPSNIRNICILAHIDHGKTTLSDLLIASNGIISNKLAGTIRYLDSREDEQRRGITMKSSAISLLFRTQAENGNEDLQSYLINLIDSPGHVDFSSEVSTSLRLCDGALVLVDAAEGVCSQTHEVLRQAWHERVRPVLVINKIDRLVTELQMTPLEAYKQLKSIVDEMNIVMSSFVSADWMFREESQQDNASSDDVPEDDITLDDTQVYFRPETGNVIFASATDGWAFSLPLFAKLYAKKLSVNEKIIRRALWGDFYYDSSSKRIYTGKKAASLKLYKPLFVQCVLENIWAIYNNTIMISGQQQLPKETLEKIANALGIKLIPRDFTSKDVKSLLRKMLSAWLPLAREVLLSVVEQLPSPKEAQRFRLKKILQQTTFGEQTKFITDALESCDSSPDAPVVVYISKLFSRYDGHAEEQHNMNDRPVIQPQNEHSDPLQTQTPNKILSSSSSNLIGFARIFSGILHANATIYLLHPKYTPNHPVFGRSPHIKSITIGQLFLLMGREVENLPSVPAGNILGIGDLDAHVLKTATLSSTPLMGNFGSLSTMNHNLVQVAVSPSNPLCLTQLINGLHSLYLADPAVHVSVKKSTGEYLISAAGELHLERCLKDLEEQYAKTKLKTSPPIVHYKETIKGSSKENISIDQNDCHITLSAVAIPLELKSFILTHEKAIKSFLKRRTTTVEKTVITEEDETISSISPSSSLDIVEEDVFEIKDDGDLPFIELNHDSGTEEEDISQMLEKAFGQCGWEGYFEKVVSFGTDQDFDNLLINMTEQHGLFSKHKVNRTLIKSFIPSLVTGFKLAVSAGPLCHEPLSGIAIIIHRIDENGPLSFGQLMSLMKFACIQAVLSAEPRLMLSMYDCTIQTDANALGRMYSVLAKRHGQILSSEVKDGTSLFIVKSRLPVVESFGFSDELRKKTSGTANPQLLFGGWEMLDQDALEEEAEEHDDDGDESVNRAKIYMIQVRKRKGLHVDEKLVAHPEKQRTLKRT